MARCTSWKLLCLFTAAQIQCICALVSDRAFSQEAGTYVAHIGSARSKEDGLTVYNTASTLIPPGKELFIHEVVGAQGVSFRVRVGPAMTRTEAVAVCAGLTSRGHTFCEPANVFELASVSPGYYGEVLLKPLQDGRDMQVAQPFGFVDSQARRWEVPSGTVTDGASIPRVFWSIIGSPFTGKYLRAAVIHDHYCKNKNRSWNDTHGVFYESMIASGETKKSALLMWAAVHRFGPRWLRSESVCWGTCAGDDSYVENMEIQPTYFEAEFRKIKDKIDASPDMALSELREFVDQETFELSEAHVRGTVSGGGIDEKTGWPRKQINEAAPPNWMNFGYSSGTAVSAPVFRVFNVKRPDVLNVRSGNGPNFPSVAKIPHDGTGVVILDDCASAWCRIRYNRIEGWVNTSFLTIDWDASKNTRPLATSAVAEPLATAKVQGANTTDGALKLRAQADERSKVLGTAPYQATTIELVGACPRDQRWCLVRYGRVEGWVRDFSIEKVIGRGRNTLAADLKLGVEPQDWATSLGTIPRGATGIAILDNCQPDWCSVRYGKIGGWTRRTALEIEWQAEPTVTIHVWKAYTHAVEDTANGRDFVRNCALDEYAERCKARVFFEGMRTTLLAHLSKQKKICAPPVGENDAAALSRVTKWLEARPDYLERPATEGIVLALRDMHPCH